MLKKPWKTITQENGKIEIYGNGHPIELDYVVPEWAELENEEIELCFKYKGNIHFLSEFMNIHNEFYMPNPPEWMKEFDGIMNDSMNTGILIKMSTDNEIVKVYHFIAS